MLPFLDIPKTEKHNDHGEGNGLRYGISTVQGWRLEMEDSHKAKVGLDNDLSEWSYFAVFDGHAGSFVSEYSSENLLNCIIQTKEFKSKDIVKGIHTGFLKIDEKMRGLPQMSDGTDKSGTTAVSIFTIFF